MAVDFTFDTFSINLFRYMRKNLCGIETLMETSLGYDEQAFPSYAFCLEIFESVGTRLRLFKIHNAKFFKANYQEFAMYDTDFYIFLQNTLHMRSYTSHLNIFDKFLIVCEIAAMMAYACHRQNNVDGMELAVYCCAMFLDTEVKDKLYDAGGWKELKFYALTYKNLHLDSLLLRDDLQNAFNMFLAACANYDMENLIKGFQGVLSQINKHSKNETYCSKCSLLLPAVEYIAFPADCSSESIDVVESLLQLVLSIKSFEQSQSILKSSGKESESLTGTEISDCANSNKEIKENAERINESGPSVAKKVVNTSKLLFELFGDKKHETREHNFCILCLRSLSMPPKHLIKDVQFNEENCAKVSILNEVKFCNLGTCPLNSPESEVVALKWGPKQSLKKASKIEVIPSVIDPALGKLSISKESARPGGSPDTESLNDLLKLFTVLGIEPVRTQILSDLKNKYKEPTKDEIETEKRNNLQNAGVLPSPITNQEGIKRIRKYKKNSKKKKNVNVNRNNV